MLRKRVVSFVPGKKQKACGKVANPSRSKRPYLIRAMHEWMADNGHTPHIVVDASVDGVCVPPEHVKDGKIILNISDSAAHNLKLVNDSVSFRARF
ncbi:MAG: ClpXP protease specificity-enhancing factor SspB, partial [Gammaproteobacteria bacterium]|nr:ClpXP protease specificity-enhancing factor SspB [Gammaproteobacteria bacterium]